MDEAISVDPCTTIIPELTEAGQPEVPVTTQEDSLRWSIPAILALNAVGAIAYRYGNNPELLPQELLAMEIGPYFPAGSLRHLIIGSSFTLACEVAFNRINAIKRPKLGAFMVALIPSVGWEIHQKLDAGHFGYGDIATAAVTGGLAVMTSTKRQPPAEI